MAERPWMPMFWGDYLADTLDLSADEHGAYLLMLGIAWRRPDGALPSDMGMLKRMLSGCCSDMHGNRFNRIVPMILERFWTLGDDGKWRQKRLGKERENAEKRSRNAQESARKRWPEKNGAKDLAHANAMLARASTTTTTEDSESTGEAQSLATHELPNPSCEGSGVHSPNGSCHAPANGIAKPRKAAEPRGSRLPEDWQPGEDGIQYAKELGLSAEQIRESYGAFMRHWLAKAGQAGRKLRWDLTWQTWVRNDASKLREKSERERRWAEQRTRH